MSIYVVNEKVLAYVIAEVNRQGHEFWDTDILSDTYMQVSGKSDGAKRTIWMLEAWNWSIHNRQDEYGRETEFTKENKEGYGFTLSHVIAVLGGWVEPEKNTYGFRQVGVRVGIHVKPNWAQVPRLIKQLCDAYNEGNVTPEEFYKEFQEIHPFVDGNGRTGKILFNWLSGTLDNPIMPPNFFDCLNP